MKLKLSLQDESRKQKNRKPKLATQCTEQTEHRNCNTEGTQRTEQAECGRKIWIFKSDAWQSCVRADKPGKCRETAGKNRENRLLLGLTRKTGSGSGETGSGSDKTASRERARTSRWGDTAPPFFASFRERKLLNTKLENSDAENSEKLHETLKQLVRKNSEKPPVHSKPTDAENLEKLRVNVR